jgi:nitroreductase
MKSAFSDRREVKAMIDWIKARRSIRKYGPEPVSNEQIRTMLEAAMAAPSASNIKPWEFVVVRDAPLRQELAQVHPWSGMAADAPVVFVICGRPSDSDHWVEDCSAATQNLLLAATALGLGGVWVGVYPRNQREDHVLKVLRLPKTWRPLCLVPVGHPAETKAPRTQYDPQRVHDDAL